MSNDPFTLDMFGNTALSSGLGLGITAFGSFSAPANDDEPEPTPPAPAAALPAPIWRRSMIWPSAIRPFPIEASAPTDPIASSAFASMTTSLPGQSIY
ncbi:hypothetical protein [Agrobacterium vitis]|uniref:hypothetical protein n=1 Tax=Agrobacterium vitis TaxID=373 RepID=UPI003B51D7D6